MKCILMISSVLCVFSSFTLHVTRLSLFPKDALDGASEFKSKVIYTVASITYIYIGPQTHVHVDIIPTQPTCLVEK